MGRTNLTFPDLLRGFRERWRPFRRGLRREDRAIFDDLLEKAGTHADAASYANPTDPATVVLLSMLLEQQAEIADLQGRLAGVEDRLDGAEDRLAEARDRLDGAEDRLAESRTRLEGAEERLDAVETDARLGGTETEARLAGLAHRLDELVAAADAERRAGVTPGTDAVEWADAEPTVGDGPSAIDPSRADDHHLQDGGDPGDPSGGGLEAAIDSFCR